MPPSVLTSSTLLPWPIATALPTLATTNTPMTIASAGAPTAMVNSADTSLFSHIMEQVNLPLSSPPLENLQPTLMSRMTSNLATRLSDPTQTAPLSEQLLDLYRTSLAERLESSYHMEVEQPSELDPMAEDVMYMAAHHAAIGSMMASAGPLVLDPVQYSYPQ